jgi:hypothetical protein
MLMRRSVIRDCAMRHSLQRAKRFRASKARATLHATQATNIRDKPLTI